MHEAKTFFTQAAFLVFELVFSLGGVPNFNLGQRPKVTGGHSHLGRSHKEGARLSKEGKAVADQRRRLEGGGTRLSRSEFSGLQQSFAILKKVAPLVFFHKGKGERRLLKCRYSIEASPSRMLLHVLSFYAINDASATPVCESLRPLTTTWRALRLRIHT